MITLFYIGLNECRIQVADNSYVGLRLNDDDIYFYENKLVSNCQILDEYLALEGALVKHVTLNYLHASLK